MIKGYDITIVHEFFEILSKTGNKGAYDYNQEHGQFIVLNNVMKKHLNKIMGTSPWFNSNPGSAIKTLIDAVDAQSPQQPTIDIDSKDIFVIFNKDSKECK